MENLGPLLIYLACPVSMGLLMWLMMRANRSDATGSRPMPPAGAAADQPAASASQEDSLPRLRAQLRDVEAQQATIAAQLTRLSAADPPSGSAGAVANDPAAPASPPARPAHVDATRGPSAQTTG